MRTFDCDHFVLPLPEGHRFPIRKYALLRKHVAEDPRVQLEVPPRPHPLAVVMCGGYARRIEDTVAIHAHTVRESARRWQRDRDRMPLTLPA